MPPVTPLRVTVLKEQPSQQVLRVRWGSWIVFLERRCSAWELYIPYASTANSFQRSSRESSLVVVGCSDASSDRTAFQGRGNVCFSLNAEEVEAVGDPMICNVGQNNNESASRDEAKT